jgi:drug/metabolite transporter (DMT)-like permease
MSWQSLIIFNAVLLGCAMLVMRIQMKQALARESTFVVNVILYVMLIAVAAAFLPWLGRVDSTVLMRYWWRFIFGGLTFSLVNVITYRMLEITDAGTVSILSTLNAVATVLLAAVALNEHVSAIQIIGAAILMAFTGYAVAAGRRKSSGARLNLRLITYTVLMALLYAGAAVNEKWLIGHISLASYAVYGWGWQLAAAVITALLIQPRAFKVITNIHIVVPAALTGLLRALGGICFIISQTKSNEVGLLTVISNSRVLLVVVVGALFLGEKAHVSRKIVASVGALLGLCLALI